MTSNINHTIQIPPEYRDKRIDQALALLLPDYSRSRLKTWLDHGQISIDGKHWRPKDKVQGNETVVIDAKLEETLIDKPENIPLNIVYEDNDILVINKTIGMVVHPAVGNRNNTLLNALLHHAPALAELPRAGIVHRLDKGTSGLLVITKTLQAHMFLVKELKEHKVLREYEAIVLGNMISGGTVNAPIGRHPTKRTLMAIAENGKSAITHYRIIERFRAHTHLKVQLETGRTHQIRVHMAHIQHPIVGDSTYGGRIKLPKGASAKLIETLRQFKHPALHARRLTLIHPATKRIHDI